MEFKLGFRDKYVPARKNKTISDQQSMTFQSKPAINSCVRVEEQKTIVNRWKLFPKMRLEKEKVPKINSFCVDFFKGEEDGMMKKNKVNYL